MAQRIDKWLVYARFVKHRAGAQALIAEGHVRINRTRVTKASQSVKRDDVITLAAGGRVRIIKVLAEAQRRGPFSAAAALYSEPADGPQTHGLAAQKQDAQLRPLC